MPSSITPSRCCATTSRKVRDSRLALSSSLAAASVPSAIFASRIRNSGKSSALMKLYWANRSLSGATSANSSTMSPATVTPAWYRSSSRPTSPSKPTNSGLPGRLAGWNAGLRGVPNSRFSATLMFE